MAVEIPFRREFSFEYGRLEPVAPMIRRIVARNPSPFTFRGTGTYVVGRGEVAVIDPGPTSPIMSRRCSRPPPHFVIE
jgi:glyoxylase-like metal-dependent hydrolase (beta-lactamase superfamily II)